MKFKLQTILSLPQDGASSHLLRLDSTFNVLLDCGISQTFDFTKYRQKQQQLKNVCLVLISHSKLEYSGALAFLVDQFGLDPNIFYTTQSIMRYSPLNIHEQLLNIRFKNYGKKAFNRIYKIYESINIIKPMQKKCIDLQQAKQKSNKQKQGKQSSNKKPQSLAVIANQSAMDAQEQNNTVGQVEKALYFTCICAGSNMGSLSWRLSFGIVNILYLVQYNNYSLYHINGIDLSHINYPTDIMITDTYRSIDDSHMKKTNLYAKIKQILIRFYQKNGMSFEKPPVAINIENQRKLVFSCYPNEMLVEIMAVVKKIVEDMQAPQNREKIRVVHLSSRYLQLIKSQMDYFSPYFKDTLQNIQQFFMHSKQISGRINIATFQSLDSLLSTSINTRPIEVYHFGPQTTNSYQQAVRRVGDKNVANFKLFSNHFSLDQKLGHSASKMDIQEEEEEQQMQQQQNQLERKQISSISSEKDTPNQQIMQQAQTIRQDVEAQTYQPLHGKYFSQVGFPRFTSKLRDQQSIFDDYGCRHQYARFEQRKTIQDYRVVNQSQAIQPQLQKKNSTIQIMNIQFKMPSQNTNIDLQKVIFIPFHTYKTNFNSSIQLLMTIKPSNVILINTQKSYKQNGQTLSQKYKSIFKPRNSGNYNYSKNLSFSYSNPNDSDSKIIHVYDINPKKQCHIQISNELISYKVNYIQIPVQRKLQKVKGLIKYSSNGNLYIHLDCLEEKEHLEFRLDKFFKKVQSQEVHQCHFTQNGLIIDGIRIYRESKKVVIQGTYSEEYFKVRRLLYDFLKMD